MCENYDMFTLSSHFRKKWYILWFQYEIYAKVSSRHNMFIGFNKVSKNVYVCNGNNLKIIIICIAHYTWFILLYNTIISHHHLDAILGRGIQKGVKYCYLIRLGGFEFLNLLYILLLLL